MLKKQPSNFDPFFNAETPFWAIKSTLKKQKSHNFCIILGRKDTFCCECFAKSRHKNYSSNIHVTRISLMLILILTCLCWLQSQSEEPADIIIDKSIIIIWHSLHHVYRYTLFHTCAQLTFANNIDLYQLKVVTAETIRFEWITSNEIYFKRCTIFWKS